MFKDIVELIRKLFNKQEGFVALHEPCFIGNERKYVLDAIDSTFVSSVGKYVNDFERIMSEKTGAKYAIATVNGTAALHICLVLAGVDKDKEVITQPLTFVATVNAIIYTGASPIFVDVDKETLGLSAEKLEDFLNNNAIFADNGKCYNKQTGKHIAACVVMHTFGFVSDINSINRVCERWGIALIEDAAESLGSYLGETHTGNIGILSAFSFNGNKTVTSGGGGAILTNDEKLAQKAKHITTTAKMLHRWEYKHDMTAYNYRMPNLNAALACAQLEQLSFFLSNKRELAIEYRDYFDQSDIKFIFERKGTTANYWLNTILLKNKTERDEFLEYTNSNEIMTRPAWELMNQLPMYNRFQAGDLSNALWLSDRIVNIPSSVRK